MNHPADSDSTTTARTVPVSHHSHTLRKLVTKMDKPTSIPGIGYSGRPHAHTYSQHDTPTSGPIVSASIVEKRGGAAFENQRFDF